MIEEEHEHEQQASINSGLEIWVPHYLINSFPGTVSQHMIHLRPQASVF